MRQLLSFTLLLAAIAASVWAATKFMKSDAVMTGRNENMSEPLTIIRLGNPQLSDINAPGAGVDKHPAGITFYQHNWASDGLGQVEFSHPPYSFNVDNVLSILGSADADSSAGIYDWHINFGVSPKEADTDEAARGRVMGFLAMLRAAGWQRYIAPEDPRLTGRQAWLYGTDPNGFGIYSLDSTYTPPLDEWTTATKDFPRWKFQADGVYLEVVVWRSNMKGLIGKSNYLISVEAQNEFSNYGIGYFGGKEAKIKNWKNLISAELIDRHKDRLKTEAELRAAGLTIDTTYQDPPIKALQGSSSREQ